jgi:prepilin-type N-terminal cleavage/methylation domain-containing protein
VKEPFIVRTSTLIERRRQLASSRSAFSLVELIIVIIIIAILAGVAYFGYQALVGRANNEKVLAGARSLGSEYRGLVGFDNGAGSNGARLVEIMGATSNVPTGVIVRGRDGVVGTLTGVNITGATVVGVAATNLNPTVTDRVLIVDDTNNNNVADDTERAVCLMLPTGSGTQLRQVTTWTGAAGEYIVGIVGDATAGGGGDGLATGTAVAAATPCAEYD